MNEDNTSVVRGRAAIGESVEQSLARYSPDFLRTGKQREFYALYQDSPSPLLVLVHESESSMRAYFASDQQARALGAYANFIMETGIKLRQPSDWQMDMDTELVAALFRIAKQKGTSVFQEPEDLFSQLKQSRVRVQSQAE